MDYFFRFLDLELLLNCLTEWQFILRVTVLSAPFLKIAGIFFCRYCGKSFNSSYLFKQWIFGIVYRIVFSI